MVKVEKKKVTLSLPEETNNKLDSLAYDSGMTKSGLINYLVNQASEADSIYSLGK